MELTIDASSPIVIGATGMDALQQNIRVIVLTTLGSVPLDRRFAHTGEFIDSPSPVVTARLVGALTTAIEKYEPRVSVEHISVVMPDGGISDAMSGRLAVNVRYHLKKGATV